MKLNKRTNRMNTSDKTSLEYIRMCAMLDYMTDLIPRKCEKLVDQIISDGRFTSLLFISNF